jgi:hypothetical protein
MARRTFFSFHYKGDNWRAGIVRNSWVTQERTAAGFFDSAEWEKVKKKNDSDIEKWIDSQLNGTSVTVVLIGEKTHGRKWINYEITASHKKGNGLLGIYIHQIKDQDQKTTNKGKNPFDQWTFKRGDKEITIPVYDWVNDDGYKNMGNWIEKAAKDAGK